MKKALILVGLVFLTTLVKAGIYCPPDITTSCFSELSVAECGNANVVSSNYYQSQVKYVDSTLTNACNEGVVYRKFYVDLDYDGKFSSNEPNCTQTIVLEYENLPLNIKFPPELTLSCIDEVPETAPTWDAHPCDLVGYTYEDEMFEFQGNSCAKILRHFSVINWCRYDETIGTGLYTGVQVIKIVDNDAPEIVSCAHETFDAEVNCETTVVLTKRASDIGNCPSGNIQWSVTIDLWADGTEDLFYGPNQPAPFKIDPIENGAELSIVLPEKVGIGNHKLVWKVTDGCANVRSCTSTFEVVDNKPPTPYCYNYLSSTLDGRSDGALVIPVELFSIDAVDNCSTSDEIELSFSDNVNDKERVVECGQTGFQFYRIYYTDAAGNQDFCEVYMLVLDNGTCFSTFNLEGSVSRPDGTPIMASALLRDGNGEIIEGANCEADGKFSFGEQPLMEEYEAVVSLEDTHHFSIDLADYQILVDAVLGKTTLSYEQFLAADINNDGSLTMDDVLLLKAVLLEGTKIENMWDVIPVYQFKEQRRAHSQTIALPQYRNGFHFYGIANGDILTSTEFADNKVKMAITLTDYGVEIQNTEAITTKMYKINLPLGCQLEYGADKEQLSLDERTVVADFSGQKHLLEKEELTIFIQKAIQGNPSIDEVLAQLDVDIQFTSLNEQKLQQLVWDIVDERSENVEELSSLRVYIQPFTDHFVIEKNGAQISNVHMYTIDGDDIPMRIDQKEQFIIYPLGQLSSGIYIIHMVIDGVPVVSKVVK